MPIACSTASPSTASTAATTIPAATATATASTVTMLPPPAATFNAREDLLDSVLQHALFQGYITSIAASKKDKYVYILCDRGGEYRDRVNAREGSKRRRTSTRLVRCTFSLYVAKRKKVNLWHLQAKNATHSHLADTNMMARRLTPWQVQINTHLALTRADPRHIISLTKKDTLTQLVV